MLRMGPGLICVAVGTAVQQRGERVLKMEYREA